MAENEVAVPIGAQTVQMGVKVPSVYMQRFRGTKGVLKRIAVIEASKIFVVRTHYHDTLKKFYCFDGSCCERENPKQEYLIIVAVYDTDKEGDPVSTKFSVQYLIESDSGYASLCILNKGTPLDSIDLIVQCEDDKFQKLILTSAGPACWLQKLEFTAAVRAEYAKWFPKLIRSHARTLGKTKEECDKALNAANGTPQPAARAFNMAAFIADGNA